MGLRGPKPTPTAVLKLRGSWRAGTREHEPAPDKAPVVMPQWLTPEAKREWKAVAPALRKMGVIQRSDTATLARLCEYRAIWRDLRDEVKQRGTIYPMRDPRTGAVSSLRTLPHFDQMLAIEQALRKLEEHFGLTPSSRARTVADKADAKGGSGGTSTAAAGRPAIFGA